MPAYRKASKYSQMDNQTFEMRAFIVLAEAETALTTSEICQRDITLCNVTPQKMARVLNELCDKGVVRKGMSKTKGRMVYESIGKFWENQ